MRGMKLSRWGWVAALVGAALAHAARADMAEDLAGKPALDPFTSLIQPPAPRVPRPPDTKPLPAPLPAPAPPALQLKTLMLVGDAGTLYAVIEYQGHEYLVSRGWSGTDEPDFDRRFRVITVDDGRVVVHDYLTGKELEFGL